MGLTVSDTNDTQNTEIQVQVITLRLGTQSLSNLQAENVQKI